MVRGQARGTGGEFYDAVVHTVGVVGKHPEIGVAVDGPHAPRQYFVDGLPYKLIYRERVDDLYIVAVAHANRRPGYWQQRP